MLYILPIIIALYIMLTLINVYQIQHTNCNPYNVVIHDSSLAELLQTKAWTVSSPLNPRLRLLSLLVLAVSFRD